MKLPHPNLVDGQIIYKIAVDFEVGKIEINPYTIKVLNDGHRTSSNRYIHLDSMGDNELSMRTISDHDFQRPCITSKYGEPVGVRGSIYSVTPDSAYLIKYMQQELIESVRKANHSLILMTETMHEVITNGENQANELHKRILAPT